MRIEGPTPPSIPQMGQGPSPALAAVQYTVLNGSLSLLNKVLNVSSEEVTVPSGPASVPPPKTAASAEVSQVEPEPTPEDRARTSLEILGMFAKLFEHMKERPQDTAFWNRLLAEYNAIVLNKIPLADPQLTKLLEHMGAFPPSSRDWQADQAGILNWIKDNKELILKGLTSKGLQGGMDGFMNLIWFFSSAMQNPSMVSKIQHELNFAAGGGDALYSVMGKFVVAYYFTVDAGNPAKIKTDLDYFFKTLKPDVPDPFGSFYNELKGYVDAVDQSGGTTWPFKGQENEMIMHALSVLSDYLTYGAK